MLAGAERDLIGFTCTFLVGSIYALRLQHMSELEANPKEKAPLMIRADLHMGANV
jgi:hypothetical protein